MKLHQFNLRDLFWIAVVVAMGLGWWLDRTRLTEELHAKSGDIQQILELMKYETTEPITQIRFLKQGDAEVTTCHRDRQLDGRGSIITFRKKGHEWRVHLRGQWRS